MKEASHKPSSQRFNPRSTVGGSIIPKPQADRVVMIQSGDKRQLVFGAGCLVDRSHVLTCRRVIEQALPSQEIQEGETVWVSRPGQIDEPALSARIVRLAGGKVPAEDLALLEIIESFRPVADSDAEFTTPLRYAGKAFAVIGFPDRESGVTISGNFEPKDNAGVLPLNSREILALGGFGGSPVWSPELNTFVGLVSGLDAVCIPSSLLCAFYPALAVKFRIPKPDRPEIKDYDVDDPNVALFGKTSNDGQRRLTATMAKRSGNFYSVKLSYEVLPGSPPPRGRFVTFITYPDMDEYELIAELDANGKAEVECRPMVPDFTIAAIGDGGATWLTLNLEDLTGQESGSRKPIGGEEINLPPSSKLEVPNAPNPPVEAPAVERSGVAFRTTYPAFEGDLVNFDQRSFEKPVKDSLGTEVYAGHLAQLIVAKQTPLPLSLGLFGDWGAGKSYFMRLLHQQIDTLTGRKDDVFCHKVVQIHFNAWHYLDTNLWANLVCEIFDNLFKSLIARDDTPNEKVEKLKKKLAEEGALAAEAKKALDDAMKAREEAEKKLLAAAKERQEKEKTVAAFIDDLKQVVSDAGLKAELKSLADGFGLTRLSESFTELEARATEARSLGGRFRTLGLTLLSPEGRWQRLTLLFVALLAPVVLALLASWIVGMKNAELAPFARSITAAISLIGAVATWVSAQTKRGAALIGKLETTYERVKKSREQARTDPDAAKDQQALDKSIKAEADARNVLNEAQTRVRTIESEIRDLAPGRRLLQFLEQRSGANDYRQHLGLVSLVRRDFQQLSRLLQEGEEFKEGGQPMLDRIVLYIDDLDRCKSDRVIAVLEAVHLLLAFPIFAVVVAVDPRWLRRSLIEHYPTLLSAGRPGLETAGESRESLASPQDYLEKIFQVPFQLQRMEKKGFSALVAELLPVTTPAKKPDKPPPAPDIIRDATVGEKKPAPAPAPENSTELAGKTGDTKKEAPKVDLPPPVNVSIPALGAEPQPVAPERLQLEEWEQAAVKACHPLFRTPRAVKRLANTYCLIRAGVEATAWAQFLGSAQAPAAEYRTPLLMLAVAAAYPGLTSRWLDGLEKNKTWTPAKEANTPSDKDNQRIEHGDWDELTFALEQMKADTFAPFDCDRVRGWLPQIKRYSF